MTHPEEFIELSDIHHYSIVFIVSIISIPMLAASQWVKTVGIDSTQVTTIVSHGQYLFAGTERGAYRSTDEGLTWSPVNSGFGAQPGMSEQPFVNSFLIRDNILYVGTQQGIFSTTNNGTTWTLFGSLPRYHSISSLISFGSTLIISAGRSVIENDNIKLENDFLRSTDEGISWHSSSVGIPSNPLGGILKFHDRLVAITFHGIFISSDTGATWKRTIPYQTLSDHFRVVSSESLLVAVSRGPISVSRDGGDSWTFPNGDSSFYDPTSMCVVRNSFIVSTARMGVRYSTDWGGNWTIMNEGLDTTGNFSTRFYIINGLFPAGDHIFACSPLHLWRRPLSQITGIQQHGNSPIPADHSLAQNYPNPFNPETVIRFSVPQHAPTTLTIYDALGREVSELLNEELPAGIHTVRWNGLDHSGDPAVSGVYFYRMRSGALTVTKKMMLLR